MRPDFPHPSSRSGVNLSAGSVSEPSAYYSYTLDNPADVKLIVMAGAAAGKPGF
jgi:pectate lyase